MKKRGSFIAGMLTMALLFGLVGPAYAAYQKQATLNYLGIKITLDGKEIIPKDAAGGIVEPFSIDGTTYLPVRAIGNALGLGVDWDGTTNTVILTSPEDDWADYDGVDCYERFSVPSLDNIVGPNAFDHLYELTSGDSIAYYYDMAKCRVAEGVNFVDAYEELLGTYHFEFQGIQNGQRHYRNATTGTVVAFYIDEYAATPTIVVLVMALPSDDGSGLDQATVSYAWKVSQYADRVHTVCNRVADYADNGRGSAAEIQKISTDFYDKTVPVLDILKEDISNDQMYALYMAAYSLTETAEEMIYRFAQLEAGTNRNAAKELYDYSISEVNEYWDLLDNIGAILNP